MIVRQRGDGGDAAMRTLVSKEQMPCAESLSATPANAC